MNSSNNLISQVAMRKNRKKQALSKKVRIQYPLYSNHINESSYNFANLKDSIYHWDSYSRSVGNNWTQLMKLYESVIKYGSLYELQECTNIINRDIIPYLISPSMVKKDVYNRLNESKSDDAKSGYFSILQTINENIECDRLLSNYEIVSHRFNIDKFVRDNILMEDINGIMLNDTIYGLCSLIDTYNMDYKPKFCIASECALYSIYNTVERAPIEEEYLKGSITPKIVLENVLDYFLFNYGRYDPARFLNEMSEACTKDSFIGNLLDDYISHLKKINDIPLKEMVTPKTKHIKNEDIWSPTYEEDFNILKEDMIDTIKHNVSSTYNTFQDINNKARDTFDKIKLSPNKSVGMLKHGISTLLVPCRAEDIAKGTRNVLSYVFYFVVTTAIFGIGVLPTILGLIFTLTVSKIAQKEYLKMAIQEWRNHKYGVERKIRDCTDMEKKRRMQAYLVEVDEMIEKLEEKYNEMRDKTVSELNQEQDKIYKNNPDSRGEGEIDPSGNVTPVSNLYKTGGN